MANVLEQDLWRVTGMNRLSGQERDRREQLARDYLERLRAEVSSMEVRPRPEVLAWAVDELNETAGCVDAPEAAPARFEMDLALAEVIEKLREVARPAH
jgi:hypothetical protein